VLFRSGVEFRYNAGISRLMQTSDGWTAIDENGAVYAAQKVIVATGGLSVPTIGTDGMGHKFLQQLGVELKQTYPALTPLTGPHPGSENLAGISMHVKIEAKSGSQHGKVMGSSNREGFLFTHKGFSGPAILDISHLATKAVLGLGERPEMLVNWSGESPEIWKDRINSSKSTAKNLIREHLPKRLAEALCENMNFADKKIAELSRDDRQVLMSVLTAYPLKWSSNEGYRKAEVTGGGVPLEALNTASMELKEYPGLYLCGEILDVFGRIGGFNFYWAWVTGRIAGLAVR
jgi:predicted Rossmann fold flavoprotein